MGMPKKIRIEIPAELAGEVLFLSDRTCCVCREPQKAVQIHHVDDDPSHNVPDNFAVLCFECHNETLLRGGFDRKLNAAQICQYRADWLARVASKRDAAHGPLRSHAFPGKEFVRIIKVSETSEEAAYGIDMEYPQLPDSSSYRAEINLIIAAFVTQHFQGFRAWGIERAKDKAEMKNRAAARDSLLMAHKIWMFTEDLVSIELRIWSHHAGAAHGNSATHTFNFRLNPPSQLGLMTLFSLDHLSQEYEALLSRFCIEDLHKQQTRLFGDPLTRDEELLKRQSDWILRGAGPDLKHFEAFVLTQEGLRIFFDPYCVGSYAEGRYEVLVPYSTIAPMMRGDIKSFLSVK